MTENYRGCYEYLSAQFEQVGGYDFYRELTLCVPQQVIALCVAKHFR